MSSAIEPPSVVSTENNDGSRRRGRRCHRWLVACFTALVPTLRYVVADVFTDTPLEGNQLAVFTDGRDLDDETMQALARETKFSETVFVLPTEADADVRIRIFTPAAEIPFAGHPTLGTAFVLGMPLQKMVIRIETGNGVVPVELEREGARIVFGRMQQPIPTIEAYGEADELLAALGVAESKLYARVEGSAENVERVEVGGSAVVVARGEFRLP